MLKFSFFGALFLCLFSTQTFGQKNYTFFKGVVSDSLTQERLPFTKVVLKTTANRIIGRDTTDHEGRFTIDSVPVGRFYAEFQLYGYHTFRWAGLEVKKDSLQPLRVQVPLKEDKLYEGLHLAKIKKDRLRDLQIWLPTVALFVIGVSSLK